MKSAHVRKYSKVVLHRLKEKKNCKSAYLRIVEMCRKYGIITSDKMTEAELRAILNHLLNELNAIPRESTSSADPHFLQENRK